MNAHRHPRQRYAAEALMKRSATRHGFPERSRNGDALTLTWQDGMVATIAPDGSTTYTNGGTL